MGRFVNPNNSAFQNALNAEIYVDKTGLIEATNRFLDTPQAFICNSRPRRFGKSMAANMLAAYYSKGCDSHELFADLAIGKSADYEKYLNQFDVIHVDVQWCLMMAKSAEATISFISKNILKELREIYGNVIADDVEMVADALAIISEALGNKFVVIIDEWDVLIRDEATNKIVQEEYINFLRGLFKGVEPTKYIALAYMTGILPIKKYKTQSALNNFDEYTMLEPDFLAPYIGFTEAEVKALCEQYHKDFAEVKRWYDGYELDGYNVYNPRAVVSLMLRGSFKSYWTQTGTYESILPLINMDFDGLRSAIIDMLSGDAVKVIPYFFQNDMISFRDKDDVLTLLIHLGYLAYNQKRSQAFIPNEEIRFEFAMATKVNKWSELISFQKESRALLEAVLDNETEAVSEILEKIHNQYTSVIEYNDENSLSSVLTIAFLGTLDYYFKPVRELPTGRGFADFVYIPKPMYREDYPALVVELKWNKSAQTALQQIKDKRYAESLQDYAGEILLVGINYDKKTKEHTCSIEKLVK
ncbi:AAA family ATPase [uncultured Phascolarctobacterium sp.]|jgi:hypothetical protein|uniref:AAA family ATPase n=1 Tax=uncultured Phascolarctobacterium sp. TaxID=512296 RepID=UPI0025D6A515|nr:AAA family ATPase [uncultured Phascolarctobacterium sp.]